MVIEGNEAKIKKNAKKEETWLQTATMLLKRNVVQYRCFMC